MLCCYRCYNTLVCYPSLYPVSIRFQSWLIGPILTFHFPDASLEIPGSLVDQLEEFDSLFDSGLEEHSDKAPPLLSDTDLAIFDPCAKEGREVCTV